MGQLRAVIFDFDGVLADTERLHLRAFQQTLAEEGVELSDADYAARYLGRADSEVFAGIARDRALPLDPARLRSLLSRKAARYEQLVAGGEVMIPGAAEQVRKWSAVLPLAVASGARRVEIEYVLRAAGLLDRVSVIVAAEDVARGKPAPDPYLLALEKVNEAQGRERKAGRARSTEIEPAHVVAVEDSPSGLAAIRSAGMQAVAVTTNYPSTVLAPAARLVVASIAELDLDQLAALVDSA